MDKETSQKMLDMSDVIRDTECQLQTSKRSLTKLQTALSYIEGELYSEICLEKTTEGKPAYSNEKVREIELQGRLRRHPKYNEIKKQYDDLVLSISANLIPNFNHSLREFHIYELLYEGK